MIKTSHEQLPYDFHQRGLKQPASIPLVDEVVEKCSDKLSKLSGQDCCDMNHLSRNEAADHIKQAILEVNASLLVEVEMLRKFSLEMRNGTHKVYVMLPKERLQDLRTQLSTADRTGYERGVKEAAETRYDCHDMAEMQQAILNLLNKKN